MIDKNSEKYKNMIACGYSEEMIDAAYKYADKNVAYGGSDGYDDALAYVIALAFIGGYNHAKDNVIKKLGL